VSQQQPQAQYVPWGPPPRAAATRAAKHTTSRTMPVLLPWLAVPVLFAVGFATNLAWGTPTAAPWAAVALTTSACTLAWVTWHACHARGRWGRWHATATVALAMAWLVVATITGPDRRPMLDLYLWGASTVAATWSIRRAGHGEGGGAGKLGRLAKQWRDDLSHRLGVPGSRLKVTERAADYVSGTVQLVDGQTPDQLVGRRAEIASHLKVPPAGVQFSPDPDDGSQAHFTVTARDLLRTSRPYSGPSRPGRSIAEPVRVATYEDGKPAEICLPRLHLLIGGTTGSGKTSGGIRAIACEVFSRPDVVLWGICTVKGEQTFAGILPGMDWAALDRPEAEAMLDALPGIITARTDHLARRPKPLGKWERGCGIPLLVIIIEEAPQLVAGSEQFVKATQTAGSAGVTLVTCVQSATYSSIPVPARDNHGARWCFGTTDDSAARYVIEDLVDAGADPSRWGIKQPGCAYGTWPGVSEERARRPMRTDDIAIEQVAKLAEQARDRHADPVTAVAAGAAYANRAQGSGQGRCPEPVVPVGASRGEQAMTSRNDRDRDGGGEPSAAEQARRLLAEANITDPEPGLGADPDADIPDSEVPLQFGPEQPVRDVAPSTALATLKAQLNLWRADPDHQEFKASELAGVRKQVGRSRAWVYKMLDRLVEQGELEELESGGYQFPEGRQ
jgi:hypothetical protein